jgi:hypothetical protein
VVVILDDSMELQASELAGARVETSMPTSEGEHRTIAEVSGPDPLGPEQARPDQSSDGALTTDEGPALRDALNIAARIAEDEAQADEARQRYQAEGLPQVDGDERMSALSRTDETAHAMHSSAVLERGNSIGDGAKLVGGTLYVTSQRVIHVAEETTEVGLGDIEEMAIALERLLLIRLRDGLDLALDVPHPRLLRVQISAAMAAARGTAG